MSEPVRDGKLEKRRPAAQGKIVPKSLILATLVALAMVGAGYGVTAGAASSHGLLFVALAAAFFAGDRGLWSRSER